MREETGGRRIGEVLARALLAVAVLAVSLVVMAAMSGEAQAKTLKVTNDKGAGAGSLRNAINRAAPQGDRITFAPGVRGTINVGEDLYIDKNLTIDGPGADELSVSGNDRSQVFYIDDGNTVRMSGLTINRGYDGYAGGGIENYGDLTLDESVVRGNVAEYGGGIYNENVLKLIDSTVSNNSAPYDGGGIENYYGTLTVQRSTVSGNRADYGGGIYSETSDPTRTTVANSTISGNSISSADGEGGGIYNDGLAEIKSTTIRENEAPEDNGAPVYSDNGTYTDAETKISSSILAGNKGGFGDTKTIESKGYNVIGGSGVANTFNAEGDKNDADARLGPLADNGGITQTHALQSGSPALGAGDPDDYPATDQRRVVRPQDDPETGSFEALSNDPGNPNACTMKGTAGNDTLRGTPERDVICGLGGDDTISGLGGNDVIRGGAGNDTIYGGAGKDRLFGNEGRDRLFGGPGVDKLYGGPWADLLSVRDSKPNDLASGGAGKDTCKTDRGDTRRSCEQR